MAKAVAFVSDSTEVVLNGEDSKKISKVAELLKDAANEKKPLPISKDFVVESVHVVVAYKTKNGKTEEVVHTIDGTQVQITDFNLKTSQKTQKVKGDDGELIGFEPTGEESLTVSVKFTKNP